LSGDAIAAAAVAVANRVLTFGPYLEARTVVAYVASDHEVPVDRIVTDAWARGRAVFLPHQGCRGFVPWLEGTPLAVGRWGIPEPRAERAEAPVPPALVLVPLVAWDASGSRLGRGGGFYDRVLAALPPDVTRVGIAYEFQEHCGLPRDAWDVPVHYVITERRIVTGVAQQPNTCRADRVQKGGLSPTWVS